MRHPGSESDVCQAWHVTGPDGESVVRIEASTDTALRMYELIRSNGYAVRPIDADEAERIETRLENDDG